MGKLELLDTTIRDGELSPAFNPSLDERIQIAESLDRAGIDIVELASTADDAQRRVESGKIARSLKNARACCISQISDEHIEAARTVLNDVERPRIHLYLDAKRVHSINNSDKIKTLILEEVSAAIKTARNYFPEVQFSPQDATRVEQNSLFALVAAAIAAGADIINISDTTGTATPELIAGLFTGLRESIPEIDSSRLSLHAHNNEGRATSNVFTAIDYGLQQVEGTINGVGPAGGNTDLLDVLQRFGKNPSKRNLRLSADVKMLQELGQRPCFV